jgi:hypothetical protein
MCAAVKKIPIEKPVFLIGMPRSGTTILYECIANHEEFAWVSRLSNYFPGLPFIENIERFFLHSGPWWNESESRIEKIKAKLALRPVEGVRFWGHYLGEDFLLNFNPVLTDESVLALRRAVCRLVKCQKKKRFLGKITGPSRISVLRKIFPDALFIHVVRDGRAVVNSLMRVNFWGRKGGLHRAFWKNGLTSEDYATWETYDKAPVVLAALEWQRVVLETREKGATLAEDKYMELRYEDFVSNPHECLADIFRFAGVGQSMRAFDLLGERGIAHRNFRYQEVSGEDIKMMERAIHASLSLYNYEVS